MATDLATLAIQVKTEQVKAATSDLDGLERQGRKVETATGKLRSSFAGLGSVLSGLGLGAAAKSLYEAGAAAERADAAFAAITGSATGAAREMTYLRSLAGELGANFYDLQEAYKAVAASAMGTALAGQETRDVFEGVSRAAASLGLTSDQSSRALTAIGQMMSKGVVSAEELRGQLGEALPGAFNLAAQAMGVTTAELGKMLERGEIAASDFLPRFADVLQNRFAGAAAPAATRALNEWNQAWTDLETTFAQSGFLELATGRVTGLARAVDAVSYAIRNMTGNLPIMDQVAEKQLSIAQKEAELAKIDAARRARARSATGDPIADSVVAESSAFDLNRIQSLTAEIQKEEAALAKLQGQLQTTQAAASATASAISSAPDTARTGRTATSSVDATVAAAKREREALERVWQQSGEDTPMDAWLARDMERWDVHSRGLEAMVEKDARMLEEAQGITDSWLSRDQGMLDASTRAILELERQAEDSFISMGDVARMASRASADAIAQMVMSGKADLASLAQSFGASLLSSGIQRGTDAIFAGLGFADGGVFQYGRVTPFERGGVVDSPHIFPMANGLGLMGEAGPEAIMPLRRGPDGKLGVQAAGGSSLKMEVHVHEADGTRATAQESVGPNGVPRLDVIVEHVEKQMAGRVADGRGPLSGAMRQRFALNPMRGGGL